MTTEQVNLPIQEGGSSVGTRGRGPIRGVLVLGSTGSFAFSALPGESIDCKEPGVVETDLGGSVTTEYEDLVLLGSSNSNVLGSGTWDLVTSELLLVPCDLVY